MKANWSIIAALALMFPTIVKAEQKLSVTDGNGLYEACTNEDEIKQAFCFGFLHGSILTMDVFFDALKAKNGFCTPPGVTNQQLKDVIIKYLRDNPEDRHNPAIAIIISAMKPSFPCKK